MPNLTLVDWTKRVDPDGSLPILANLLAQTNHILMDAPYVQGNLPTGHQVSIVTGLPVIYYRSLNQGIPTSTGSTAQVVEQCSILEATSEVDLDLANLNDNAAAFRLSEGRLFIEGMNQAQATGIFYGNPASNPQQYLGLSARYSSKGAGNGQNIIDGGGTGSACTSGWLICWSDETVFMIFPKGSKAGLLQEDLGRRTSYQNATTDTFAAGNSPTLRLEVLAERYQWKTGLCVKDWRYAVRIANLQTSLFSGLTGVLAPTTFTHLLHLMAQAVARIPNLAMGKCAFYFNRSVFTLLMRTAFEKSNSALAINPAFMQFGAPHAMLTFMGVQIRQCDALLNTETQVV